MNNQWGNEDSGDVEWLGDPGVLGLFAWPRQITTQPTGEVMPVIRRSFVPALAAAALLATVGAVVPAPGAVAAPAGVSVAAAHRPGDVTPQTSVPTLDAPGPAKTVTYNPDNITRRHFSRITVQAPQHTRITRLVPNCDGWDCPVSISADGKSATADFPSTNWIWIYPVPRGRDRR
ncbi:hypothetical protein GCM10010302_05450 [Streptomyces polychromogenes]|uniref:Transposase n=1 Tax=Streptomyces polychromogenes TaxID=67342 RepID=A0ABP3EN05_9ACTN